MTWKEAIHKARVKLVRVPLQSADSTTSTGSHGMNPSESATASVGGDPEVPMMPGEAIASEFAYQIEIVEDLDDDRVHSFEDDEPLPGAYGDVQLAGVRDFLPIHEISKIFYADTGKILNIGNQGETNSPVLLLKRDINAAPPRRMMQSVEKDERWLDGEDDEAIEEKDAQTELEEQIRRESSIPLADDLPYETVDGNGTWRLPPNLDPEWLAFEVYTEAESSDSDDERDVNNDSAYESHRPSSSGETAGNSDVTSQLANLNLNLKSSPPPDALNRSQVVTPLSLPILPSPKNPPFGPIRSSLSLLEMLIRLTSLQQFQQASHLSIPDELLTFFLEESSTTGAGGDGEERRRTRREARRKVGFDPYDESPVKRRGEDYQYQGQGEGRDGAYSRSGTPYEDDCNRHSPLSSMTPQSTPSSWLPRSREASSAQNSPEFFPSSPMSRYGPPKKATRLLDRTRQDSHSVKAGSPLGRGMSVETDSTLGTSPGSPPRKE